ncbi:hypothetical protein MAH1_23710 [Sessilibacter sp. MAH1]
MQVKRFKAADMRRALEMVRAELGEDAVILSNTKQGKYVEILATADDCTQWLDVKDNAESHQSVFSKYEGLADTGEFTFLTESEGYVTSGKKPESGRKITGADNLANKAEENVSYLSRQLDAQKKQQAQRYSSNPVQKRSSYKSSAAVVNLSRNTKHRSEADEIIDELFSKGTPSMADVVSFLEKAKSNRQENANRQENTNPQGNISNQETVNRNRATINNSHDAVKSRQNPSTDEVQNSLNNSVIHRDEKSADVNSPSNQNLQRAIQQLSQQNENSLTKPSRSPESVRTATVIDNSGDIKNLQSELNDMRELLELQLKQSNGRSLKSYQMILEKRFSKMGFGEEFITQLLNHVVMKAGETGRDVWLKALKYLKSNLPLSTIDIVKQGGRYAFIGPTGAGKTTTIAKLATQHILEHGRHGIAIISTDNERLGSQSQLKSLSHILQIPLHVVTTGRQLNEALFSLTYCDLILIDSPGINIRDLDNNLWFNEFKNHDFVAKIFVMTTNSQKAFQKNILSVANDLDAQALVLTKLDECCSLGDSLDCVIESKLPIAYLTNGQNVPKDIEFPVHKKLIAKALEAIAPAKKSAQLAPANFGITEDVNNYEKVQA